VRSLLPLICLLVGCPSTAPEGDVDLVRGADWVLLEGDEDPLAAERPADAVCSPLGVQVEDGSIEISTDACPWATVSQPLLDPVLPTDTLDLLFFHNALAAPLDEVDPEARVELHLGGHVVWELRVPIPHEAELHAIELEPGISVPFGQPAVLHVSNHGQNSYRLTHLKRLAR
jgi:hypothetical protein